MRLALRERIKQSELYKSIFRHGYSGTRRNRYLTLLTNFFLHLHPLQTPHGAVRFSYTWGLGGISFLLFCVLTVTGVLLMFFYVPDTRRAYDDMKDMEFAVAFGLFLRNLHRWAGHAMVITAWLHMLRVFLTSAYKKPRQFNWAIGVSLLVLTLLLSFSGYLLPWDQIAFWAITVGTNMSTATPFLGAEGPFSLVTYENDLRFLILGGRTVGQSALLVVLLALVAWSLAVDAPLEEIANLNNTPNPAKAPWYFVGLQEMLVYFDPWIAGVILPGMIIIGLTVIPYVDPNPNGVGVYGFRHRPYTSSVFLFGFFLWVVLILVGEYFRGPGWGWYWPWESAEVPKPIYAKTWDFPMPIGLAILLVYFNAGMYLPRRLRPELFVGLSQGKYLTIMFFLLCMVGLPIKMLLRLLFNMHYVLVTPWFKI